MSTDVETQGNAQEQGEKPEGPQTHRSIHPDMIDQILGMWKRNLKAILEMGALPRVMISIRVDSHLEKKYQLSVTFPGLSTKAAIPLVAGALKVLQEKARREELENGPKIIIPS